MFFFCLMFLLMALRVRLVYLGNSSVSSPLCLGFLEMGDTAL